MTPEKAWRSSSSEPPASQCDDLVEARLLPLPGRRAQRGIGGEEDALRLGNVGPLADLGQRDHILLAPADGGPVAARVLEQLVGLAEPERPLPSPEQLVEDDGGDLPALAAAGAVAQHPAAPEAHRVRQRLVVARIIVAAVGMRMNGVTIVIAVITLAVDAVHGLPSCADAVERGEMALVGLAGEDDALELGIGQEPLGHDPRGQHGTVRGRRVRHGCHGAGLHQRGGMLDRTGETDGARPPGLVRTGGVRVIGGFPNGPAGFVFKLGDGTPVMRLRRGRGRPGTLGGCPAGRRRMSEQIGGTNRNGLHRLDGQTGGHCGRDGLEQLGGVRDAGARIDRAPFVPAPVEHGESGVEGGAAARVDTTVDDGGEHHVGRQIERCESILPGGIARNAMGGRDGYQSPARRQHREGRANMAQVGVLAGAVHAGACREGRVHQDHGGTERRQPVAQGFGVVASDGRAGEQAGQEPGAGGGDFVKVEGAGGAIAERARSHHREHAGAGGGFEHDIARTDGGGLEGGVSERQRRRELLQRNLLLGAPRLRRLQGSDGLQHGQHGGGAAGIRPGLSAHGTAVALEEEDQRGFGRLVGVLPDPGALGVGSTEGVAHGVAQRVGIERAAVLQDRQQAMGGGQQCGGLGTGLVLRAAEVCGSGRGDGGGGCARGRGRRRMGVEHGQAPMTGVRGRRDRSGGGAVTPAPLRPACLEAAARPPYGGRRWWAGLHAAAMTAASAG